VFSRAGKSYIHRPVRSGMEIIKSHPEGKETAIIGKVTDEHPGTLSLQTTIGSSRIVDVISGEQLPRICQEIKKCTKDKPKRQFSAI